MSIFIESPNAESIWQVVQQLSSEEIERLKELINAPHAAPDESADEEATAWREASSQSARRFFEEESA